MLGGDPTGLDVPAIVQDQLAFIPVRVHNASPVVWPAAGRDGWYQVNLGNHWMSPDGAHQQFDADRAPLPRDLPPGETCEVVFEVRPPAAGDWRLSIDLVQEGVAWFSDRGSPTAEIWVRVTPPRWWRRLSRPSLRTSDAPMEMHGVPEALVREWVADAGGEVLSSFDWDLIQPPFSQDWHRRGLVLTR